MENELFDQILAAAVQIGTSDIHFKVGAPCMIRSGNDIVAGTDTPLKPADIDGIVRRILEQSGSSIAQKYLDNLKDLTDHDTSFSLSGVGRFRVNIARQRGTLSLTLRVIAAVIKSIDELDLPEVLKEIALEPRGLILVAGATGSGKSTTLAAMLDHINRNKHKKIITIEDPIEFLMRDAKCFVTQRELGGDTQSFAVALRAALRQNPDVVMVGELRDRETVEIALKASETGHAVFSTLHTSDAEGTITRICGVFDPGEQPGLRQRLAESLKAIVSQRLVPRSDKDGRIAAIEIMRTTSAIRERIETADTRGFLDLIEQGWNPYKMQTFDQYLTTLYKRQIISLETGLAYATSPTNFKRNLTFEEK